MRKEKKEKFRVFYDCENISEKKYDVSMERLKKKGQVVSCKAYRIKNDKSTRAWTTRANKDKCLKEIRLSGGPEKNKVDSKIIKDIRREIRNISDDESIVIVSSDKDFSKIAKKIRASGGKVIGIGEAKASDKLRKSYDEFLEI